MGEAPKTIEDTTIEAWRLGWYDRVSRVNAPLLNLAAQAIGRFRIRARARRGIRTRAGLEAAPPSPSEGGLEASSPIPCPGRQLPPLPAKNRQPYMLRSRHPPGMGA